MPQAVWTGRLSFGLVNIPVKLYSATAPKNVRFHQYDAQTGGRIRYRRVAAGPKLDAVQPPPELTAPPKEQAPSPSGGQSPSEMGRTGVLPQQATHEPTSAASHIAPRLESNEEAEVPWDEIVKGLEIEPGRMVTVTPDELAALAPERSEALEVEQFVPLSEIDPVYFGKSYYVAPQPGVGAERPYWLLYRAMESTGEVAVGRFVMRSKQYLAAVRPVEHLLMLETMFYADEVRDPKGLWIPPTEEPPERELEVARRLIEALSANWDPARHRDEYRERVLDLLRSKSGTSYVAPEPEEETVAPLTDLMEALKASVEAAKEARGNRRRKTG